MDKGPIRNRTCCLALSCYPLPAKRQTRGTVFAVSWHLGSSVSENKTEIEENHTDFLKGAFLEETDLGSVS